MYTWSEVLAVAEAMGVELVWARICLGQLSPNSLYLCRGQSVGVQTRRGKTLMSFKCVEPGTPDYARLAPSGTNPFTHRLVLQRLGA